MSVLDDAIEATTQLIELETKKIETLRQLRRGLLIAKVLGVSPKDITGKLSTRVIDDGPLFDAWRKATFVIRIDGEDVKQLPLRQVPEELWPADLLAQYKRSMNRIKRTKE